MNPPMSNYRERGFTLVELMVVVALLAILTSIAVPSFQFLIERWRVLQAVENIRTTLFYARSEAIRRGGDVFIEKLPSSTPGCTLAAAAQNWDCGWVVFIDANNNQRWNAGEEIQRFEPSPNLTVTRTTSAATIPVDRWGIIDGGSQVGFAIAPVGAASTSTASRDVCIAPGGRIKVAQHETSPCPS